MWYSWSEWNKRFWDNHPAIAFIFYFSVGFWGTRLIMWLMGV